LSYSDLLTAIQNLFGSHILDSIDSIRCVFSRDDALRLSITNDDDLNKVIAIAEANQATKLNFLLTQKKGTNNSRIKSKTNQNDSDSISDDGQQPELDDGSTDSPPPGTIAPQKRRTAMNTTRKSTTSKDGGFFIPESVRLFRFFDYEI
jgi:hypothetical protein